MIKILAGVEGFLIGSNAVHLLFALGDMIPLGVKAFLDETMKSSLGFGDIELKNESPIRPLVPRFKLLFEISRIGGNLRDGFGFTCDSDLFRERHVCEKLLDG